MVLTLLKQSLLGNATIVEAPVKKLCVQDLQADGIYKLPDRIYEDMLILATVHTKEYGQTCIRAKIYNWINSTHPTLFLSSFEEVSKQECEHLRDFISDISPGIYVKLVSSPEILKLNPNE